MIYFWIDNEGEKIEAQLGSNQRNIASGGLPLNHSGMSSIYYLLFIYTYISDYALTKIRIS